MVNKEIPKPPTKCPKCQQVTEWKIVDHPINKTLDGVVYKDTVPEEKCVHCGEGYIATQHIRESTGRFRVKLGKLKDPGPQTALFLKKEQEMKARTKGAITSNEQLDRWVEGESLCPNDNDECCPDFSCCCPDVETPRDVREAFRDACLRGDDEAKWKFLMGFLGGAIPHVTDKKVHIAGATSEDSN